VGELYELLARGLRGIGGSIEAISAMAESEETRPVLQAHARYAAARAAVEQGDNPTAADALSRAQILAMQHARELLPAISRLKAQMSAAASSRSGREPV
jgi:hypothetical protein